MMEIFGLGVTKSTDRGFGGHQEGDHSSFGSPLFLGQLLLMRLRAELVGR
jgi:hypothetical protein